MCIRDSPVPLLPSWSNYFSKLNNYEKQLADVYGATYVSIPFAQTEMCIRDSCTPAWASSA